MIQRIVLIVGVCAAAGYGQPWQPPAGESNLKPKIACASLRSQTDYGFTVATATLAPAGADNPEYCRVTGLVLPAIQFEVSLPSDWNRRFYMSGNGGYAGEPVDAPNRAAGRHRQMRRGFAAAITNTGHDGVLEPLASFAQDRQKLFDYAFRSLHTTAATAKLLIQAYYGAKPSRSYFEGCSTGGRQALILAQRFPDDFDGIVVGAPVLNFSGTMLSATCTAQALSAAPIPPAKMLVAADRIYALCDAKDGLKDGVIDDPRRCDFQPARDLPKCAGDADQPDCFTTAQIGALEKIYGDVMGGGKRLFPGWPVGAEVAGPNGRTGWDQWIVRDQSPTISAGFAGSFWRYMAFPGEKDPKTDITNFDFNKDPARLEWIHNVLDATDTDLSGFKQRSGKLLMYYGWADQALNPRMGVEYYESVTDRMGASTREFFRLFMVPGMYHCGGGVGTSTFDMLSAMRDWVEQGKAPDRIEAMRVANGKVNRTRPLCPYPQVARYKGSGSTDDTANFTCASPQ